MPLDRSPFGMPRQRRFGGALGSAASHPFRILGAFVALIVLVALLALAFGYGKTSHVQFKLTDKNSVTVHKDDHAGHEYRLYTTNGTYKVTDSIIHLRFNAADVYGKLQVGKNYDCKVYGWRIPVLSHFKNVLDCTETNATPQ